MQTQLHTCQFTSFLNQNIYSYSILSSMLESHTYKSATFRVCDNTELHMYIYTRIITPHVQAGKWLVMYLLLSMFGDLDQAEYIGGWWRCHRVCYLSWEGHEDASLILRHLPPSFSMFHSENREPCFSYMYWKAGWSLGMRLRYIDATNVPGSAVECFGCICSFTSRWKRIETE